MTDHETLEQVALKVRAELTKYIEDNYIHWTDETRDLEFARRLLAEQPKPKAGLTPCGFGDDDERWGETVEEYVQGCADSYDYDDLISGEPFCVDAQFYRSEQWRTVSLSPVKCERVDASPAIAGPDAAPVEPLPDHICEGKACCQEPAAKTPETDKWQDEDWEECRKYVNQDQRLMRAYSHCRELESRFATANAEMARVIQYFEDKLSAANAELVKWKAGGRTIAQWRNDSAELARLRAVMEGKAMVPRDPTEAMLQCWGHEHCISRTSYECYDNMLAAAQDKEGKS